MEQQIEYRDISRLTQKAVITGSEKIVISAEEFVTPNQIVSLVNLSGYVTTSTSSLQNYYLKSDTYNKNEVDTISSDFIKFVPQVLTEDQKLQARINIGANSSELYWAVYSNTTSGQIDSAINAGKVVLCVYNNKIYYLTTPNGSDPFYYFHTINTTTVFWLKIQKNNNAWSNSSQQFQPISDKVLTLVGNESSDVKYPTTKAVSIGLSLKQDIINDLEDIRSGASSGSTAYHLPVSGIPLSDLSIGVKQSLSKADTAYQLPQNGIPKTDLSAAVLSSLSKADTAYQLPQNGIPKTDLSAAVQTALDLAETAIQPGYFSTVLAGKQDIISDLYSIRQGALAGSTAYQKPSSGIPRNDLSSSAQLALSKADTAYQKPSSGIPKTDLTDGIQTSLGKADTAYQLPQLGVPLSDLSHSIQVSLGKADTALQSVDIVPLTERISTIESVVPTTASSDNKLADKRYVNSSIATNTANYISNNGEPFTSLYELQHYSGVVTNNDYAFVVTTDSLGNTSYTRYKYSSTTQQWAEEYVLNNSSFTDSQWDAINSGITGLLLQQMLQDIAAAYVKPSSGIPKTDLTNTIQVSLNKADTAYQLPQSGVPRTDLSISILSSLALADTAYQLPQNGIPKTDLSDSVRESLVLADTSVQSDDLIPIVTRISAIEDKIPVEATPENKLADKQFVTSSIVANTANYISNEGEPFTSVSELRDYEGPLTNNDFAFVVSVDSVGNTSYTCYRYKSSAQQWFSEYTIYSTSFSPTQWRVINSGIDTSPVQGSNNLLESGGAFAALSEKASLGDIPTVPVISNNVDADRTSTTKTVSPKGVVDYVDSVQLGSFVIAWDGESVPIPSHIPRGVRVEYNYVYYTGTLDASSTTLGKTYMVSIGDGNYDRYITQDINGSYSWIYLGSTTIDLSGYVTDEELEEVRQMIEDQHVFLTESAYQNLTTKDPNVIYCTYED